MVIIISRLDRHIHKSMNTHDTDKDCDPYTWQPRPPLRVNAPRKVNINDEVVPVLIQAPCHEGVLGNGGIAPRILDFDTRWR